MAVHKFNDIANRVEVVSSSSGNTISNLSSNAAISSSMVTDSIPSVAMFTSMLKVSVFASGAISLSSSRMMPRVSSVLS
jgi:hypothetical protein